MSDPSLLELYGSADKILDDLLNPAVNDWDETVIGDKNPNIKNTIPEEPNRLDKEKDKSVSKCSKKGSFAELNHVESIASAATLDLINPLDSISVEDRDPLDMIDHNAPLTLPPLFPGCSVQEFNKLQKSPGPVSRRRDNGPEPSIDLPDGEKKTPAVSRQTRLTVNQQFEKSAVETKAITKTTASTSEVSWIFFAV